MEELARTNQTLMWLNPKELFGRIKKYGTIFFGALKKHIVYDWCFLRYIFLLTFHFYVKKHPIPAFFLPGVEKAPEGGRIGEETFP